MQALIGGYADEFNTVGGTPSDVATRFARARAGVKAAGRDPDALVTSLMTWFFVGRDRGGLRREAPAGARARPDRRSVRRVPRRHRARLHRRDAGAGDRAAPRVRRRRRAAHLPEPRAVRRPRDARRHDHRHPAGGGVMEWLLPGAFGVLLVAFFVSTIGLVMLDARRRRADAGRRQRQSRNPARLGDRDLARRVDRRDHLPRRRKATRGRDRCTATAPGRDAASSSSRVGHCSAATLTPFPTDPAARWPNSRSIVSSTATRARAAGMTASEVRALFAVASRPEVVSLAGGMPYRPGVARRRRHGGRPYGPRGARRRRAAVRRRPGVDGPAGAARDADGRRRRSSPTPRTWSSRPERSRRSTCSARSSSIPAT